MNQDTVTPFNACAEAGQSCQLMIAFPLALEEEMLDLLREHKALVPGFSVVHGQGLGGDVPLTTMMERVEGRARRVLVYVVMRSEDVGPLLAKLRAVLKAPQVFYWAVPLQAFGSLA
ncbi:MAG: DUF3240 family protein [Gammaproteobacteria bacterium]|jgi:hypothetical protein|nr:DUF3240 family protein [Gammaproteobacteria bacterium]MBU0785348.1 DUF3240 family protein [Gammaproteobacteria bacterium]MBU0815931.1 DUF3240 family protein [Gammaproteobacteria bacterium]MBU1787470.1 DUF3240 family protein [Gammaproteobacteria bacterium]